MSGVDVPESNAGPSADPNAASGSGLGNPAKKTRNPSGPIGPKKAAGFLKTFFAMSVMRLFKKLMASMPEAECLVIVRARVERQTGVYAVEVKTAGNTEEMKRIADEFAERLEDRNTDKADAGQCAQANGDVNVPPKPELDDYVKKVPATHPASRRRRRRRASAARRRQSPRGARPRRRRAPRARAARRRARAPRPAPAP